MSKDRTINKHIYPIIDVMMEKAEAESKEDGECLSCFKGCSHCCHLLVEVSWDEAEELVYWLETQPKEKQDSFVARIQENAMKARAVLRKKRTSRKFAYPVDDDSDIPESAFDEYFFNNRIPCPMLEDGVCGAYEARPSPCRLHVVTSPSEDCTPERAEDGVETPQVFDDVRDEIGPVLSAVSEDPRWGQLGIMVEAVLKDRGMLPSVSQEQEAATETV